MKDYKKKYEEAKKVIDRIKKAFNERKDADDFADTLNNILRTIK